MMHSATSESNSDQERSINEYLRTVQQSPHVYGNMHALSMLPQISGHSFNFPSPFYTGPPQGAYHPSLSPYGPVLPPNAFVVLPIIFPQFPFISPQIMAAPIYYPFRFQPVLPQIASYQPFFNVGHIPQLNDPRISSVAPYVPFPLHNEQPQITYQQPVEPALSCEFASNPSSSYVAQPQSISQPSVDPTFDEGQQPHDSSVLSQVQSAELVPANNLNPSSSDCVEQLLSTYSLSLDPTFNEGQQPQDSTLPSQVQSAGLAHTSNIYSSTSYYPGQPQSTYQPSFDPAFCGEQMDAHKIPYQPLDDGIGDSHAPQEPNKDTSEVYPSYLMYSEELQSTCLSSFQPASDYPPELSRPQVSSSALGSVNQDHSFSLTDLGSYSSELFNPFTMADFQQNASPQDITSPLKRSANEIYPLGPESGSSGQLATAPSFEDAHRPRKRLKEVDIISTSCVPEERMQLLSGTADHHNLHTPETFPVDGCRIVHDQRMDLPVQNEPLIHHYETQNDTSILHGAHNVRISGNPVFTNIGVNNMTNHSGAHDLDILAKFVSFDALHDSSIQNPDRRCHPGTRENVLTRLQAWTNDPSASEHIVWLHGLPGAGKSSIAQTIIRKCGREKIVATFFFYRSDPSRSDGNRLFATIAWQLASSIPGVKSDLVKILTHRPDLPMKDIETQFEELVVQPFQALNDTASHLELRLAPVVVIDGVDECTDERLQRRFLNVIGNAIRERRIPLRFLILSRPEAHIKETVNQFECPTLCIDLESIDDANHDIELYFSAEFSRIAGERDFDPTWPGDHIIQELLCDSSGQFVYAATVIKYVGDAYNCAKAQLEIILGLRKRPSTSPFAPLDELYTEILKRQSDQDFLKDVLALFVACISFDHDDKLHADFPTLLNVSEEEMGRKLRGMQSLLAFEGSCINFHHQSFLDFLQDMSRSDQYHISERASSRRYLELITGTIVRYVSDIIDQPQCPDTQHLHLQFSVVSRRWPHWEIDSPFLLAVADMRDVLQSLLDLQDNLLNLRNFTSSNRISSCNRCDVFQIMRNILLQLALSQAISYCITSSSRAIGPLKFEAEGDYSTIASLPEIEVENSVSDKDLDGDFASLLACMRNMPRLRRKFAVLDAQNLVNLIDFMMHDQNSVKRSRRDLTCKAKQLLLEIYARVPVIPQSLLLYEHAPDSTRNLESEDFDIEHICSKGLMARVLNCRFIGIHGLILDRNDEPCWAIDKTIITMDMSLRQWSRTSNASHSAKFQVMLELCKSIQYFHSVGAVISDQTALHDVLLGPEYRPQFHMSDLYIKGVVLNYQSSIFAFGRLFYEMYFDSELYNKPIRLIRNAIVKRPSEPEIREDAWQLIQRCCAEDPKSRPTIDEVVQEMESWGIEPKITMPASSSSFDS